MTDKMELVQYQSILEEFGKLRTDIAVIVEHQAGVERNVQINSDGIKSLSGVIASIDKRLEVALDRLGRTESDTARNQSWIMENWTKLAELGAVVALITKTMNLW